MSKRRSEYELTADNWNQEEEPEEFGRMQLATEDVLKTRVIKQARRRIIPSSNTSSEPESKSVFSNFNAFAGNTGTNKFSFGTNFKNNNANSDLNSFSKRSTNDSDSTNTAFSFLSKSSDSKDSKPESVKLPANNETVKTAVDCSSNREKLNELSNKLKKTTDDTKSTLENNGEETPYQIFLRKLKSLNLLCAEWIIRHLNENLDYILTPIFDDYAKHLEQLREERQRATSHSKRIKVDDVTTKTAVETAELSTPITEGSTSVFKVPDFKSSLSKLHGDIGYLANKKTGKESMKSFLSNPYQLPSTSENTGIGFKFPRKNILKSTSGDDQEKPTLFQFGQTSSTETKSAADSLSESKPSSFFSFKPENVSNSSFFKPPNNTTNEINTKTEEAEEDQPPVVEDETITEEGSIYDKKCKVFVKKDGNFVDHGVGFLFLKLVGDEKKCQVIVRANNKLKNIIINVLLTNNVPVQLLKKNNVMMVCCPTPEDKQPTSVLFRVKTSEDAEELLSTMNKYKK